MKNKILVSDDSKVNSPIDEGNIYGFMINDKPISLEAEIIAKNNKIYKFNFDILKDKIIAKWLYEKMANKFYEIFGRDKKTNGFIKVELVHNYEDGDGNTKKVRNDATYNKDYLTGRYGAIPVLQGIQII